MKSKSAKVVLDKPNVNFWFLTTDILGFIGAIDWFAPPEFAVIDTMFIGLTVTSLSVCPNWKYLSLIL